MLEQIIAGGTNCPKCGAGVSSVTGRLFGRHHICPACGCPCMTPGWVYLAALAAGAVAAGERTGPDRRADTGGTGTLSVSRERTAVK